jgi:FkbM family methyltransferase
MGRLNLPGSVEAHRLFQNMSISKEDRAALNINKPLILYGAGDLGKMAKEYFELLGIPFLYVVDANVERHLGSTAWKGISVVRPEDVPQEDRARCLLIICIATVSYAEVTAPLIKQGWQNIVPFYDITEMYIDRCPLSNGWFTGPFDDVDMVGIEYALDHWNDDISRAHYLQFMAWHGLRREVTFDGAPVTTRDRFFIPEVVSLLHEREVFIDGGAYHGEVSLRFMNIVHNRFSKVCAIEPDRHNVKVLRAKFADVKVSAPQGIEVIECALGKQAGSVKFFHGLGYASQFSSITQEVAVVRTLDDMDIPATFIKLHLEGWECGALQGGMRMINKYRPILATTTYHKRNGLWQLPVLLMKGLEDYVFLFRLHSWMGTGSVLYAIPRERYLLERP